MTTEVATAPTVNSAAMREKERLVSVLQEYINLNAAATSGVPGTVQLAADGSLLVNYTHPDARRTVQSLSAILYLLAPSDKGRLPDPTEMERNFDPAATTDYGNGLTVSGDPVTHAPTLRIVPQEPIEALIKKVGEGNKKQALFTSDFIGKMAGKQTVSAPAPAAAVDSGTLTLMRYFLDTLQADFQEEYPAIMAYHRSNPMHLNIGVKRPPGMSLEQAKQLVEGKFGSIFGTENVKYYGAFKSDDTKIAFDVVGAPAALVERLRQHDPKLVAHIESVALNPNGPRLLYSQQLARLITLCAERTPNGVPGAVEIKPDGEITVTYAHSDPSKTMLSVYAIIPSIGARDMPDLDTLARTFDPAKPLQLSEGVTLSGDPATHFAVIHIAPNAPIATLSEHIKTQLAEEEARVKAGDKLPADMKKWTDKHPNDPQLSPMIEYFATKSRTLFPGSEPTISFYGSLSHAPGAPKFGFAVTRPANMPVEQVEQFVRKEFGPIFGEERIQYHGAFASTDTRIAFDILGAPTQLAPLMKRDTAYVAPGVQRV